MRLLTSESSGLESIPSVVPENRRMASNNGQGGGQEPVDFSEFLWMENEEEFDEQVLRELEDEEMINYYFDLYEDSLEAEANGVPYRHDHELGHAAATNNTNNSEPARPNPSADDLSLDLNRILTFSTLNPNAAEFVPGQARNSAVPNNSDSSSGNTSAGLKEPENTEKPSS